MEGETADDGGCDDAPSVSMTTTSSAYSLIDAAHPVFGKVKKLWNSPLESHREVHSHMSVFTASMSDVCDISCFRSVQCLRPFLRWVRSVVQVDM